MEGWNLVVEQTGGVGCWDEAYRTLCKAGKTTKAKGAKATNNEASE